MLRIAATLLLMTAQAYAWETTASGICTLSHDEDDASVQITYDPLKGDYALAITIAQPWPDGPIFAMRFDGPRRNTITTNRHALTNDGKTLTVTDKGFGNVLDGIEFNFIASALTGNQAIVLPLAGAAPAVQAFRVCAEGVGI